jgi:hypothetical protein
VRHRWGSRVRGRRRWWTREEEEARESELGDGEAGGICKPRECALKRWHSAEGMASPRGSPRGRRALRHLVN